MIRLMMIILAALALLTVLVLGFRGQTSSRPPLQGFWDMADQRKYKAQAESDFFADGRTMRMPPAGAVAWGRSAGQPNDDLALMDQQLYSLAQFPIGQKFDGQPFALDEPTLARGRKQFDTYCAACHGYSGSGTGITTQYGLRAISYHTETARKMTVGQLYQIITEGRGQMPPYGPSLRAGDRFAVIAYVRALQLAHLARLDDVADPAARQRLSEEASR